MATFSSKILTGAASINTSYYLLKSAADQILPAAFRHYLTSLLRRLSKRFSSHFTVVIHEYDGGITYNHRFAAVNTYLGSKLSPLTRRIKVSQPVKEVDRDVITVDKDEEVTDSFDGVLLTWVVKSATVNSSEYSRSSRREERSFELSFLAKHKDLVLKAYLPYVTKESDRIKEKTKVLNLHSYSHSYRWRSVTLTHPSSFETIAMEPEAKTELIKDLDNFIGRKDYYKRVGKAWKRGYLLYGPPGTGKSTLVAAMAKYLNFDIYDLDLKSVRDNSELLELLVRFQNKSILVIEDIDRCGIKLDNDESMESNPAMFKREEITMSGLLNFIDGLWSSCGEERIIVLTTNHKEKLDPALLRPGRMDVHIEMSYCKFGSFKSLARNYLNIEDHKLFGEIEVLLSEVEVSPADVAGQLMKRDDAAIALQDLVNYLTSKKTPESEEPEKEEDKKTKELQVPQKQENKSLQNQKVKVGVENLKKKKTRRLRKYKLEILVKHI